MAIRSGFFDSTEIIETAGGYPRGDRAESADFFARYFSAFIGNGIYPNPAGGFAVTPAGGLKIKTGAGMAFINGYFAFDDDYNYITLTSGPSAKICRVTLRLDLGTGTVSLRALDGDIALTRSGGIYELGLADVAVAAGAAEIRQADITDLRLNSNYCGLVTGVIEQIDTSGIAAQLDGVIEQARQAGEGLASYIESAGGAFEAWFESMKGQLSTDAAGRLELSKADIGLNNAVSGSVLERHLGEGAVTSAKIGAAAVLTNKIAQNAVTAEKLALDVREALFYRAKTDYSLKFI